MQEEKDKVQAQKEEVLNHMNDVLENELQCIICSEYFIEVSTGTPPHAAAASQAALKTAPSSLTQSSLHFPSYMFT